MRYKNLEEVNEKKKYRYVFVILTYKNSNDLKELLNNIAGKINNYKVIVVNSYYDEKSCIEIKNLAESYECDFLNVDNKGYGYGNNRGIEHCKRYYDFDFLVIANPDIIIKEFNFKEENFLYSPIIIAPNIISLKGKCQNPYFPLKCNFSEWLMYYGCKVDIKLFSFLGMAINKVFREIFLLLYRKKQHTIFAAHGSCVIFNKSAIEKLYPIYDEQMFLFSEEALLAHKAYKRGIQTIYTSSIKILHKEDGSISISNIKINEEARKSTVYYYEAVRNKK